MNRIITVIVVCMAMISCSRGSVIAPWEQFQYVFDKDGRSVVELDPTKHRYMLYTTEPSDSSKLIQLLNKHNCSFPVILDQIYNDWLYLR